MDKNAHSYPNQDTKTQPAVKPAATPPSSSTAAAATTSRAVRSTQRAPNQRRKSKTPSGSNEDIVSLGKSMTIDKFKIDPVRALGEGSYAKVCAATHVETGNKYACKIINDKKDMGNFVERFLPRELKLMRKFNSPRVTCVYGIFKTHNLYYILMDYAENGDLLRYLQRKAHALEEDEVRDKALQILMGVKYLHDEAHVAHRDLKCENILIDGNNKLMLADFGFARSCVPLIDATETDQNETRIIRDFMNSDVATLPVPDAPRQNARRTAADKTSNERTAEIARIDRLATSALGPTSGRLPMAGPRATITGATQPVASTTFCGSVAYAAPEVLSRKSYDPKKYDMWSAGVIVFIMACFFMPFDDSDQAKMVRRQLAKKWRYPPDLRLSDSLKEFLEGLMEPTPKERFAIGDALRHKWLRRLYREALELDQKNEQ